MIVVKDFIYKGKARGQVLIEDYKELKEPPIVEMKFFFLLRRYRASFVSTSLIYKKSVNRKGLPLKAEKAIKTTFQAETLMRQITTSCKLMLTE